MPARVGRYHVIEPIGSGGMGDLYLARDPDIGRSVAIKLLKGDFQQAEARERFSREARAAGRLQHPNIVTVYDVGEHEGHLFIAMEFVRGRTLASLIARRDPLSLGRKLEIMEALCRGLAHAHRAGIIHRDIKPSNVMVNDEGELKLLDFGIARFSESSLTQSNALLGTPYYMAPEQLHGARVDQRSDIFAAGAVCYELLSGQKAFDGPSAASVFHKIVSEAPRPLEALCPDLEPDLVACVGRALHKDRDQRYQDADTMREDLRRVRLRLDPETAVIPHLVTPPPGAAGAHGPGATPVPTPSRGTDRGMLLQRRARQIQEHLAAARGAFEAGRYPEAAERCEQALLLDPDDEAALVLAERVQAARAPLTARTPTAPPIIVSEVVADAAVADASLRDEALSGLSGGLSGTAPMIPPVLPSPTRVRLRPAHLLAGAVVIGAIIVGAFVWWPASGPTPVPAGEVAGRSPVVPVETPAPASSTPGGTPAQPTSSLPETSGAEPAVPRSRSTDVSQAPAVVKAPDVSPPPQPAGPAAEKSVSRAPERVELDWVSMQVQAAATAVENGRYDEAVSRYDAILAQNPGHDAASRGRAQAIRRQVDAQLSLGGSAMDRRDWDAAIVYFDAAARIEPGNPVAARGGEAARRRKVEAQNPVRPVQPAGPPAATLPLGSRPGAPDARTGAPAPDVAGKGPGPVGPPGRLEVGVRPWATIVVDGREMGTAPAVLTLPPGPHTIRLVHPSYQPVLRRVVVRPGESAKLVVNLEIVGIPK